jgi:hypothetical protein
MKCNGWCLCFVGKTLNTTTEDNDEDNVVSSGIKFNWEDTITAVLSSKGESVFSTFFSIVYLIFRRRGIPVHV